MAIDSEATEKRSFFRFNRTIAYEWEVTATFGKPSLVNHEIKENKMLRSFLSTREIIDA